MVFPPRPHGTCNNQNRYNQVQSTCDGNRFAYSMSTTPMVARLDGYSLAFKSTKTIMMAFSVIY